MQKAAAKNVKGTHKFGIRIVDSSGVRNQTKIKETVIDEEKFGENEKFWRNWSKLKDWDV